MEEDGDLEALIRKESALSNGWKKITFGNQEQWKEDTY